MKKSITLLAAMALTAAMLPATIIGPDSFGYTARDKYDPGGIAYHFTNIAGTGTLLQTGDDNTVSVTLGAPFTFYGTSYGSVNSSTNGNLQFASNSAAYVNTALSATGFGPTIFAFWDDLYFTLAGQGVYYQYFPSGVHPDLSGPTSVFQWTGEYFATNTGSVFNVQALLEHNTGRILTQYNHSTPRGSGTSATIGIQNGAGVALQVVLDGAGLGISPNDTVLFSPVPEPQTYALIGAGLLLISLIRRRQPATE